MGLAPNTATVIRNGEEKDIPIEEVEVGDIVQYGLEKGCL